MRNSQSIILVFLLAVLTSCKTSCIACNLRDKQALLLFKQGLRDPSNRLSSWYLTEDCCGWAGVHCHNMSGRVFELHLGKPDDSDESALVGHELSPALIQLEHLNFLNLSFNDFRGTPIPTFLCSMKSLTYLNLWGASFGGLVPHQLGNLSSLRELHLGGNSGLYVDNLSWISLLSSMESLDLAGINLSREIHWLDSVSLLPSLSELYLPGCQLNNMISSLGYVNFTSLTVLSLPSNNFIHNMPNWLFNLTNLLFLDLSDNSLQGQIPSTISNLHDLYHLNLSANMLTGQIPESTGQLKHLTFFSLFANSLSGPIPSQLGNLSSLSYLFVFNNKLNGTLPRSLGLLSNLVKLFIRNNSIAGSVSEVHFAKLSKLKGLSLGYTSIEFNVSHNWIPPFQLKYLDMRYCKMGPKFPMWLQTQRSLLVLDLVNVGIVDKIPNWFWKWASLTQGINLAYNQISGDLSRVQLNSTFINLYSNSFTGQLPHLSSNLIVLSLASNSLSGQISSFFCQKMNGGSRVQALDISDNALTGELPGCLMHWKSLTHLNLGSNNLSGEIPDFMGSLFSLKALHLHNNSFSGGIPLSLRNCTSLGLIDFAENKLTGNIPGWIGERSHLMILRLRSNEFFGDIPLQICQLSSLIVLDLAHNGLSGSIPRCLNNISAMVSIHGLMDDKFNILRETYSVFRFTEWMLLVIKGRESVYRYILPLVRMVDLSCNNLSGGIPIEISSLLGLQSLNLSRNHLKGEIPKNIGDIENLESLDLSNNHLLGEIPQSMINLTFLNHLNLSYNNFSGRIPSSTQLQSFDALDFSGNPGLCGAPLLEEYCTEDEDPQGINPSGDENGEMFLERSWFCIGMEIGFIVSFWGVCVALLCKRSWRHAYFKLLDNIKDWVCVATVLKLNWFRFHLRRHRIRDIAYQ